MLIGARKDASFAVVVFGNVKKCYKKSTLSSRFDYDNGLLMSATVYLVQSDIINTIKILNKTLFGKSEC